MSLRDPDPNPLILIEYVKPLPNKARLGFRLSLPRYSLVLLALALGHPLAPELVRFIRTFL